MEPRGDRPALALFIHLRLHYQLLFLSPLFAWGFVWGGARWSTATWLGFLAIHVCLYGGITAYNSFYDRDEGPVGGLRHPPPVSRSLLPFSLGVQLIGLLLCALISTVMCALYLCVMLLSVAYSHPRFRWKARPLLSLFVVAFGQGVIGFLAGYVCAGGSLEHLSHDLNSLLGMAVASLVTVGMYPLTQLYQVDEDRARGDITFSVRYGALAGLMFAQVSVALAGVCMAVLVWRAFGPWDALLCTLGYAVLLLAITRWRMRFKRGVEANFVAVHRLQVVLSTATLLYLSVRMSLGFGPAEPPRASAPAPELACSSPRASPLCSP